MSDQTEDAARDAFYELAEDGVWDQFCATDVPKHATEAVIVKIAALVRREVEREREECAKVCDPSYTCGCSAMIRARNDVPGE